MAEHAAFAPYGRFHWPPLPSDRIGDPPAAERTALEGRVDIFYVDEGEYRAACVRWIPRHPSGEAAELRPRLTLPNDELANATGNGSRGFAFRLDDAEHEDKCPSRRAYRQMIDRPHGADRATALATIRRNHC